jgi:hypothetical protein
MGCALRVSEPSLHPPAETPARTEKAPVLKVHMRSGELYVLDSWSLKAAETLDGEGKLFSLDRREQSHGRYSLPLDSIALVETDSTKKIHPAGLEAMAVLTTFWGVVSGICVADPKSCFGSCPTFYVEGGSADVPAAEGFSDSIASVLEARDVDALYDTRPSGRTFALRMRNEALETHAVRHVQLLAVRRLSGGRVFADTDGRMHPAVSVSPPIACRAPEGDCLPAVRSIDGIERSSAAAADDLAARETLEVDLPAADGPSGIVIGARQTFVTTFILYQTSAHA